MDSNPKPPNPELLHRFIWISEYFLQNLLHAHFIHINFWIPCFFVCFFFKRKWRTLSCCWYLWLWPSHFHSRPIRTPKSRWTSTRRLVSVSVFNSFIRIYLSSNTVWNIQQQFNYQTSIIFKSVSSSLFCTSPFRRGQQSLAHAALST